MNKHEHPAHREAAGCTRIRGPESGPSAGSNQHSDAHWASTQASKSVAPCSTASLPASVQGAIVGASAALAIVIACLGLFALAAFTAERRTKEIGLRKTMGASRFDVMRLLLWQFTKPVLLANVVAWPLAYWAAALWLDGFAYRVSLPPWLFLSASITAVMIAWGSVAAKAWLAANTKPATALQCE